MTLLEKIDYLRRKNNLNKRQLSLQSGIPYSTIDGLYKIGYENMRLPTFCALCRFFGVTMESMAYDENEIAYAPAAGPEPPAFTPHEKDLIHSYRDLDPGIQSAVDKLCGVHDELEEKEGIA